MKVTHVENQDLLSKFFFAIKKDARISTTHIGIYAALVQYFQEHGKVNPMYVFSHELMPIAKISAHATYHNGIRALSEYGYIKYEPSFKRNKGSKISMRV